jgi:hypothetical protein
MAIWDVSNLVQAVLLTIFVFLGSAAVLAGGLLLMSRLETSLPEPKPHR